MEIEEARRMIKMAVKQEIAVEYIKTDQEFAYYTFKVGGFLILTFNDGEDSDWIMEIKKDGKTIWVYEGKPIVPEELEDMFCELADDIRKQ